VWPPPPLFFPRRNGGADNTRGKPGAQGRKNLAQGTEEQTTHKGAANKRGGGKKTLAGRQDLYRRQKSE